MDLPEFPETQSIPDSQTAGEDLEDLKYTRMGYSDLGRKCDFLLKDFLREFPATGTLPLRWRYTTQEDFQKKYHHLGMVVWAKASNSHLLLINGSKVLRIWTDVANTCWIDLSDPIAGALAYQSWGKVEPIPPKNARKSKPFTQRIKVWSRFQMRDIAAIVRNQYGLDQSRLLLQSLRT